MSAASAGIAAVAAFVAVMLAVLALVDAWFAYHGLRSLGARLNQWAGRYPLYSLALVALLGALIAHFFLHTGI